MLATAAMTVKESHTARAVGDGSFRILATPVMIALMERAACKVLADVLEANRTSVGTRIDVAHTAAAPLGARISATATITKLMGRTIEFAVAAANGSVEIGRGTHTRVLVDAARFAGEGIAASADRCFLRTEGRM
jgi:predicted thioesterase